MSSSLCISTNGRQALNAADRLMLVAHDGMRSIGHPGFICQNHAWFSERVDVGRLRTAIDRLGRRHPVVTARIVRKPGRAGPCWEYQDNGRCVLHEMTLQRSDDETVWRHAEMFSSMPLDLGTTDPLRFHLFHLPDGRDVLVMVFSHVLMDGKAPELVLAELNELSQGVAGDEVDAPEHCSNDLEERLLQATGWRRLVGSLRLVGSQISMRGKSLSMIRPDAPEWVTESFRMRTELLSEGETTQIEERTRRICGFTNFAPALLASAFRVTRRLSLRVQDRRTIFRADVPLNLRAPAATRPLFRNFMSFISLSARPEMLENRDGLTRELSVRMRDQLRRGMDIGALQMMAFMSRFDRLLGEHLKDRMQNLPLTLHFGFLGPASRGLEMISGTRVERIYTLNAGLAPPGITLQANIFQGRMNLGITYVSEAVSDSVAGEFLAALKADLLDERSVG